MQNFLNNYIDSLSTLRRQRVGDLLQASLVARDQIALISQRLSDLTNFVPILLRDEVPKTIISSDSVLLNLRDAFQRVAELYRVSNLVSLLLDSHSAILGTDVKAIEDQLIALEKMANSYAFLLSDSGSYNYAYLEPFSDERGRDSFGFDVPDRDGTSFKSSEQASVRSTEGVLAIPSDLTVSNGLFASVVKANAAAFITSDTGLANALSLSSVSGWRATLSTKTPVTNSLPELPVSSSGVQFLLEFRLTQPAPSSEIKLVPFSDLPVDILQVKLYTDETNFISLLDTTQTINQTYTLHFPIQAVTKFQVVIGQSVYTRSAQLNNVAQQETQRLHDQIIERRSLQRRPDLRRLYQIVRLLQNQRKNNNLMAYISFPFQDHSHLWGPLSGGSDMMSNMGHKVKTGKMWNNALDSFEHTLVKSYQNGNDFYQNIFIGSNEDPLASQVTDTKATLEPAVSMASGSSFDYQYSIGLKYVGIGTNAPSFKGVFVSRPVPAPGDIGEVKLKAEDSNFSSGNTSLDSTQLTSIEYSVSNVSDPRSETDWIPILPVGQELIIGERLFFDNTGKAFIRFQANRNGAFYLYKNGYIVPINVSSAYIIDNTTQNVSGLALPSGSFSIDDIFTCDYIPAADYTVTNFNLRSVGDISLSSTYDNAGAGEGFLGTSGRNSVDLNFHPFIDYAQVDSSIYYISRGLTPYQPVVVKLDDGTTITNLTNYKDGTQTPLPIFGIGFTPPTSLVIANDIVVDPITKDQITRLKLYQKYATTDPSSVLQGALDGSKSYYYIHSGNTLMFNQPIPQSFRVYYQYLQNSVRVRVALRVNTKNFVTPTVDAFHLKAKTRRANAKASL